MKTISRLTVVAALATLAGTATADDIFVAGASGNIYRADASATFDLFVQTSQEVTSITFIDDVLYAGTTAGNVMQYELATGALVGSFNVLEPITALTAAGTDLFVGTESDKIIKYDMTTGTQIGSLQHINDVNALTAHNGNIIIGGIDTFVYSMPQSMSQPQLLTVCGGQVTCAAATGDTLLLGTLQGRVYSVNSNTGTYYNIFNMANVQHGIDIVNGEALTTGAGTDLVTFNVSSGAQTGTIAAPEAAMTISVLDLCEADWNGDGSLDIFDYVEYGNSYSSNEPRADLDHNGSLNVFDYIAFGNLYAAGCK
ncbi:MAG: PQQ-binding-like beta-propeller repeat protein [Phycisphaeraceae bacterium]|nr:PQQ-binding-like beta-propeller repeat protein [Phycisphaerales bacterium]MCB9859588.1 PQQ-binding-like beta-propeller repeat protein [Phycisphaeraceae bacterium]